MHTAPAHSNSSSLSIESVESLVAKYALSERHTRIFFNESEGQLGNLETGGEYFNQVCISRKEGPLKGALLLPLQGGIEPGNDGMLSVLIVTAPTDTVNSPVSIVQPGTVLKMKGATEFMPLKDAVKNCLLANAHETRGCALADGQLVLSGTIKKQWQTLFWIASHGFRDDFKSAAIPRGTLSSVDTLDQNN